MNRTNDGKPAQRPSLDATNGEVARSDNFDSAQLVPKESGVYQIKCRVNGKIYVGSSVNMRHRWSQHRRHLNEGRHRNAHLQAAWTKYGESTFHFSVLQFVERSELLRVEQEWLVRTNCTKRGVGYNIYDVAGSPGHSNARMWEGFISPEGVDTTIVNLHDFCHKNDLDFPSMLKLAHGSGRLKSYKGWTHKNSPRMRPYCKSYSGFIAPDGSAADPIYNLAAFCRQHGLEKSHMVALYRGKLLSHGGWTHVNSRDRIPSHKSYSGFVDPSGVPTVITNLKAFCDDQGLSVVHMHQVKSGLRRSHKGWIWRDPA